MVRTCAFPFLAIVSMRGQWGEFVPWQIPMAQATPAVLSAMGVIVQPVGPPADVAETITSCTKLAFDGGAAVAMLLNQRLIGAKEFQQ
jgi:sulfopyruvate decarboxylase TPP-binding subunit